MPTTACVAAAETRDRTGDLQIFGLTLSQLSYRGLNVMPEFWNRPCDAEKQRKLASFRSRDMSRFVARAFLFHRRAWPPTLKNYGRPAVELPLPKTLSAMSFIRDFLSLDLRVIANVEESRACT